MSSNLSPNRFKKLHHEIVEFAAHKSCTFYTCPKCEDKVYTVIENGIRTCFRCMFNNSPPLRCTGCVIGCHDCTK